MYVNYFSKKLKKPQKGEKTNEQSKKNQNVMKVSAVIIQSLEASYSFHQGRSSQTCTIRRII